MRVSPILTAFNAGELSPQLKGRVDLEKYALGCETVENFIVRSHGGLQRRPGSYFLEEIKDSSKAARLIPFQYSTLQAYVIEMGGLYMRFYKNYAQLQVSGAAYEIVSPYAEADIFDVQYAQDADIMYLTHHEYPVYKLSRTGDTAWTLEPVVFIDGPYLDTNDTATTITPSATTGSGITLTASAALFEAGHVGAFFRLFHGSTWGYVKITYVTDTTHATANVLSTLGGTGATATWREGAWSIKRGFPTTCAFFEQRLALAGSTYEPQTIWASVAGDYECFTPGTLDDDPLTYTIADREVNSIRWMATMGNIILGTTGGEARMGQQSQADPITPSNCKITFQSFFGSSPVPGLSVGNAVLFWERAGHPANLGEKLRELSYKFETDGYVGVDLTILAEHIARGGVSEMALQQYPYRIMWCVRNDGVLIGLTYERDQDVVAWHRHPTDGLIDSLCIIPGDYQDDVYVIAQRSVDGALVRYIEVYEDYDWGDDQADCFFVDCGLSYEGTEKTITGATAADPVVITATSHGFTAGQHLKISDVAGMTELNGLEVVVANETTHTFECQGLDGSGFTAYISGGIAKEMAAALSGLDHLEGCEVDVLTDGAVHPAVVVASGSILLEWYCCKAQVGLHYDSKMKTMPLEGGSREGTTQGKQTRIHEVSLRFYETLGGETGPDEDNLDSMEFRTSRDSYGNPPALFTGDKDQPFPGDWDSSAQVMVVQDQPLPMTILALMPRYRTEDR